MMAVVIMAGFARAFARWDPPGGTSDLHPPAGSGTGGDTVAEVGATLARGPALLQVPSAVDPVKPKRNTPWH
jgi:hypothetical protein